MNVQIEVSTRCNFDCFYCAGRDMQQADLSLQRYLQIMAAHVERYGVPEQISLQGEGEPTLNKDFFEMAAHVRSIGAEPYTITNGTYKNAHHFAESFKRIGVSIDTMDEQEATSIGRHNLPRVLQFVKDAAADVAITIHSVATSASVRAVSLWCRQNGYTHIVQPLQGKADYQYRYPQRVQVHATPEHFSCDYLSRDLLRYYSVDGTEFPCQFIKDPAGYVSIDALRGELAERRVPVVCRGCAKLS